jgi:hypothetical protein
VRGIIRRRPVVKKGPGAKARLEKDIEHLRSEIIKLRMEVERMKSANERRAA